MLSFIGDIAGMRVLDIGCGAGQLSHALIQRNAKVTGIDVSSSMVEPEDVKDFETTLFLMSV